MKTIFTALTAAFLLAACTGNEAPRKDAAHDGHKSAAQTLDTLTEQQREIMNKTPVTSGSYPSPPAPHYGPEYGSITFTDTDPSAAIGGTLTMKPAVDETGKRLDEAQAGITMYMIHWGLEVGAPGTTDDKGAGDLGGDCMGFRDTSHIVMMSAADAAGKDLLTWELPAGTAVPDEAKYFVGHTLYGKIHNLGKCTQTVVVNLRG